MELPGIPSRLIPSVMGAALAAGSLGGFMGPLIVGYLTDLTGSYLPGFIVCCIMSLSLFVGGLFLPETGPKAKRRT
jgi:nitrate/nitrite transporter NarK